MRVTVALSALALMSLPAFAADAPPRDRGTPPAARTAPNAEDAAPADPKAAPRARGAAPAAPRGRAPATADNLLDKLAKAQDEREARGIERQIEDIWSRSGSPTVDLLLDRCDKALDDDDDDTAQAILTKLTDIAPNFAEGWHRLATVASNKDDYEDAVMALRHVLSLQPKHFGALAELGGILEEFGDKEHALAAYREAIKLDPYIDGVPDRIKALTREVEGQGI